MAYVIFMAVCACVQVFVCLSFGKCAWVNGRACAKNDSNSGRETKNGLLKRLKRGIK